MESARVPLCTVPFREYLVNPSWQAAQGLEKVGLGENMNIYIKEVPVSYIKSQQVIVGMWETVNPKFAIHLGIAPGSRGISLEQTGKNHGYRDRDVCAFCPVNHCCIEGGLDRLDSIIDMRSLSKDLKQMGLDVIYSRDAGRYLCDFVYFCSPHHGHGRAAFIHVPASGSLATPERLVPLLQTVIQAMLNQLEALQTAKDHMTTVSKTPEAQPWLPQA
ncbi:pyroglutamyl-peptidase 1 [Salvelinus sp. IW2-2015]|uniref:pyroglutamyl-peptidase 1 n=1 Tax=Salvelinus sp. IW2-2015 TaxID=2691554 RepID=UPI0038D4FC61